MLPRELLLLSLAALGLVLLAACDAKTCWTPPLWRSGGAPGQAAAPAWRDSRFVVVGAPIVVPRTQQQQPCVADRSGDCNHAPHRWRWWQQQPASAGAACAPPLNKRRHLTADDANNAADEPLTYDAALSALADDFGFKMPAPDFVAAIDAAAVPVPPTSSSGELGGDGPAGGGQRRAVLVSMSNRYALDALGALFLGSLANVTHAGTGRRLSEHLVLLGFTPDCVAACKALDYGQRCVLDDASLVGAGLVPAHSLAWRRTGFTRVRAIVSALSVGVDALFLDTDWVLFKDPLPYIWERRGDVFATMVCHHVYDDAPAVGVRPNATLAHPGHVNIGLTYFRASPGALRCADAWLARLLRGYEDSAKIWDQKLFPDAMHHCAAALGAGLNILHGMRFPSWCRGGCGCDWRGVPRGGAATWLKTRDHPRGCPAAAMAQWYGFHFPCNDNVTAKAPLMRDKVRMYHAARAAGELDAHARSGDLPPLVSPSSVAVGAPSPPPPPPPSPAAGPGRHAVLPELVDEFGLRMPSAAFSGAVRAAWLPVPLVPGGGGGDADDVSDSSGVTSTAPRHRRRRRAVLIAMANAHALDTLGALFLGSLANVTHAGTGRRLSEHLVLLGFTSDCVAACKALDYGQRCVLDDAPLVGAEGHAAMTDAWRRTGFTRVRAIANALSLGADALFLDADWLLFKDPLPYIWQRRGDVFASLACSDVVSDIGAPNATVSPELRRHVNVGLTYWRASAPALRCALAWAARMQSAHAAAGGAWDQWLFVPTLARCMAPPPPLSPPPLGFTALSTEAFPSWCRGASCGCSYEGLSPGQRAVALPRTSAADVCLPRVMAAWLGFHFPCARTSAAKRPRMAATVEMYEAARRRGALDP